MHCLSPLLLAGGTCVLCARPTKKRQGGSNQALRFHRKPNVWSQNRPFRVNRDLSPERTSISLQPNVDFSVDKAPFLSVAKCPNQFLKCFRMLRSIFKPCQKIKRLANIATMIELACDRRQIAYSFGNVMRLILEHVPALLLRQIPPSRRFSNWDKGRPRCLESA